MVRPCVLRHRVTVPTLCSLGEPEIAIGPEPRIEPWLPRNRIACQVSRAGGRCHYSKMNRGNGRAIQRRTSRAIESHQQIVGWISRQKISRLPAEGEPFLLTSPRLNGGDTSPLRSADATEISRNYRNVDRTGWSRASSLMLSARHGYARLSSVVAITAGKLLQSIPQYGVE